MNYWDYEEYWYRAAFLYEEDCKKYCGWLNEKENSKNV